MENEVKKEKYLIDLLATFPEIKEDLLLKIYEKSIEIYKKSRGSICVASGIKYEKTIWNICSNIKVISENIPFCIIKQTELGNSSNANDIVCNYVNNVKIPIEIKKSKTPDWMQLSIKPDVKNVWRSFGKNKITENSKNILGNIIDGTKIFNDKIPPFLIKNMTHENWTIVKSNTNDFDDVYIDCMNDTISKLYKEKGCYYIQISDYGLYHTGVDICNFNVPFFQIESQLRIRIKIHKTNIGGLMTASVMCAAQPKKIKSLVKSKYSLDDFTKLPINLTKINN